jgi:hypothetical protein
MRPEGMQSDGLCKAELVPLPPNKTVIQVFGDFLAYLFGCAKRYIIDTHSNGASLWASFGQRIEFVLTHPNGWEGLQQSWMRQAAVHAKLVPDTSSGHKRIHFVSEGEASLLYCVNSGLAETAIQVCFSTLCTSRALSLPTYGSQDDASVMIIDAGGGTIDISSYKFITADPVSAEEIAAPDCKLRASSVWHTVIAELAHII